MRGQGNSGCLQGCSGTVRLCLGSRVAGAQPFVCMHVAGAGIYSSPDHAVHSRSTPTPLPALPLPSPPNPLCLQEYRRRGQDPDEFLAPLADLLSISIEELGYLDGATFGDAAARDGSMINSASDRDGRVLRDYCSLLDKLWLRPVAWHDKGTSIRVRAGSWAGGLWGRVWWLAGGSSRKQSALLH